MTNEAGAVQDLLSTRVRVPEHVVRREFVAETVVLNLNTGTYHGLNPTASRMLDRLEKAGTVREAARALAVEYQRSLGEVQRDLCELCRNFIARDLVEIDAGNRR